MRDWRHGIARASRGGAVGPSLLVASLLLLSVALQAEVVINVGKIDVPEGSATFEVPVLVSGGDMISDANLFFQVADGGGRFGGEIEGPKITGVDYTGSIWGGDGVDFQGALAVSFDTQLQELNISRMNPASAVAAAGTLCTLEFSTDGAPAGGYDLLMVMTKAGDSTFQNSGSPVAATVTNGCITLGGGVVEVIPPRVELRSAPGDAMELRFDTLAGLRYRIEWTPVLGPATWTEVETRDGIGGWDSWVDDGSATGTPPSSTPRRFYRVVALPAP